MPTISSPRSSGAINSARKPARKTISFAGDEIASRRSGDLDRFTFCKKAGVIFGSSRPMWRCVSASINS